MITENRMRLGEFEFDMDFGSFRRITECWSGPGWDFNFCGSCVKGDFCSVDGRIGLYCEAAPLPLAPQADYTGIEIDLPGTGDEESGEPFFAFDVGESSDISDVRLRFIKRDGNRYLIEMSGTASASILGHPEAFTMLAWAEEQPDHSYGGGSSAS